MRGWSVIPVTGDLSPDPAKAKRPAVPWKTYQRELPTTGDLRQWFTNKGYPGLAVVCGEVSGLVVMECDTPDEAQALIEACPFVQQTYTVLSANKRLPHYYLQPPPGAEHRFRGQAGKLELRGNGQYVVTFPTVINGKLYELPRGGDVRELTSAQWTMLCDHIEQRTGNGYPEPQTATDDQPTPVADGHAAELVSLYFTRADKHNSRNAGLFDTACIARDNGWTESGVASVLLPVFEQHAPYNSQHSSQTSVQRCAEGLATIASAFSRLPRVRTASDLNASGLPTLVREHLLRNKKGSTARIHDALLLAGVSGGDIIAGSDIVRLCVMFGIGHATVKSELKDSTTLRQVSLPDLASDSDDGTDEFFSRLVSVQVVDDNSKCYTENADENLVSKCPSNLQGHNYCVVRGSKRDSIRGRKPQYYRMLTTTELCEMFGVTDQRSDALPEGALSRIKPYRKAVTAALIRRRPGPYSQHWLAERVGVKPRTIRRHVKEDEHIQVKPRIDEKRITETNLTDVPADLEQGEQWGYWLQDETGQRYPPFRKVALRLLKQGHKVWYCTQLRNFYQHVDNVPRPVEPPQAHEDHAQMSQQSTESRNSSESADSYQKQGA